MSVSKVFRSVCNSHKSFSSVSKAVKQLLDHTQMQHFLTSQSFIPVYDFNAKLKLSEVFLQFTEMMKHSQLKLTGLYSEHLNPENFVNFVKIQPSQNVVNFVCIWP
jgi:hypothetical protein